MGEAFEKQLTNLAKVLSRFSLHEQHTIILPNFSKLPWENILGQIEEHRLALNSKNVASILVEMVKKKTTKVTPKISKVMSKIVLMDIQCHSLRRIWLSYEMQGEGVQEIQLNNDLAAAVVEKCENSGITVKCQVMDKDNLYWMLIEERKEKSLKKKRKKTQKEPEPDQYKMPIFIAAVFCEPYFHCCNKNAPKEILMSVTAALGYDTCKKVQLSGKDVNELTKCLKLKEGGVAGTGSLQPAKLQPGLPVKMPGGGLDFTGRAAREKYVDELLGENLPILKCLTFRTTDSAGPVESDIPELDNMEFPMQIKIKSDDAWRTVKEMIKSKVIPDPVPEFYALAAKSGRDTFRLKKSK